MNHNQEEQDINNTSTLYSSYLFLKYHKCLYLLLVFMMNNTKLIQVTKTVIILRVMILEVLGFSRNTEV